MAAARRPRHPGRKNSAAALGAVNAVLSVVALAQVVTHLERPANVAGYAVGVAVGVYLGVVADERLTREPLEYRVLVDGDGDQLAEQLHHEGWPVTRQLAVGPDGPAAVFLVVVDAEDATTRAGNPPRMRRLGRGGNGQTTESGSSFWPVGPIWISVSICGQTPQS